MFPTPAAPVSVYLGLGSNQGDRLANLRGALTRLGRGVELARTSSVYETEPWGFEEQPWFLNLVCQGRTELSPVDLLGLAKAIELSLGRRPAVRYGPRTVDVDLLLYGEEQVMTPEIVIPHPHIQDRAFVLIPLDEIAPDLLHPVLGKPVRQLLEEMRDPLRVRYWGPPLLG